jgi:REP element-mobilizing transposase RayT
MAHTYNLHYIHCLFSTKRRLPRITDREKVWSSMLRVTSAENIKLFAVGGMTDHIHLLNSSAP